MRYVENEQPLLDWKFLDGFTLGQIEIERRLLELFCLQAQADMEALQSAQTSDAWRQARHSLQSTASAIGAKRLGAVAASAIDGTLPPNKHSALSTLDVVLRGTIALAQSRLP